MYILLFILSKCLEEFYSSTNADKMMTHHKYRIQQCQENRMKPCANIKQHENIVQHDLLCIKNVRNGQMDIQNLSDASVESTCSFKSIQYSFRANLCLL